MGEPAKRSGPEPDRLKVDQPDSEPDHPRRRGPEPERLVIEGPWEDAVKKALQTPRPPGGWPKPERNRKPRTTKKKGDGA